MLDYSKLITGTKLFKDENDYKGIQFSILKVSGIFEADILSDGHTVTIVYTDFNKFDMSKLDTEYLQNRTTGGDGNRLNQKVISVKWVRKDSKYSELTYKRKKCKKFKIKIKFKVNSEDDISTLMDSFEECIYRTIDFRDEVVHEFMCNIIMYGLNKYAYEDVFLHE